jgi:hypothetical protein
VLACSLGSRCSGIGLSTSILVVFPVTRTSYNRVARLSRPGKLVKLPRSRLCSTATISNGGGGPLRFSELEVVAEFELVEERDSMNVGSGEGGDAPRGNIVGDCCGLKSRGLGSMGELAAE